MEQKNQFQCRCLCLCVWVCGGVGRSTLDHQRCTVLWILQQFYQNNFIGFIEFIYVFFLDSQQVYRFGLKESGRNKKRWGYGGRQNRKKLELVKKVGTFLNF